MRLPQRYGLGCIELAPLMEATGNGTFWALQHQLEICARVPVEGALQHGGVLDRPPRPRGS